MKKIFSVFLVCFASTLLWADMDLRVQRFVDPAGGTAKVISAGWKNYALELTASADSDLRVTYDQLFTFYADKVYELSADIKQGDGSNVFAELRLLDIHNKPVAPVTVPFKVHIRKGELKGRLDMRGMKFSEMPRRFQLVIGVKKGSALVIEDIEFDIDNNDD